MRLRYVISIRFLLQTTLLTYNPLSTINLRWVVRHIGQTQNTTGLVSGALCHESLLSRDQPTDIFSQSIHISYSSMTFSN
ncbi:Uncharacterized protein HZ326_22690 [Fusarium oxysporum f. sp. albedinis]|nr:Uncharacterized protein HZ326_22690 [Fusarium oxysporum f. sp. albedinis]